ncbi:PPE domain-containing protein [Actinosynnema pretiosum]|nr:PPE domain-containing protein [Actinosynnema pretiosum]
MGAPLMAGEQRDHRNNGDHGGGNQGGGDHEGGGHGGYGRGNEPSELGQKVDWMTYTHQELYDMVHTGVDLDSATSAKAGWSGIGKSLGEVRDLLVKAINQSSQAWEGETADRAREGLESVMKWAQNTSDHADNVATCINEEIQHVVTAREQMPAPVPPTLPAAVAPGADQALVPSAIARGADVPATSTAESALTGSSTLGSALRRTTTTPESFAGLDTVAAPAAETTAVADATHRQAAEVMAMFQQNSYAVDLTVPSFSAPVNPVAAPTPGAQAPLAPGGATADGPAGAGGSAVVNPAATTGQSSADRQRQQGGSAGRMPAGAGRGAGGYGGGGGVFARGRVPSSGSGSSGGSGGSPLGATPIGAGGSSANIGSGHGASGSPGGVTSQFQASKAVTPQHGMIGATPMAAPPPMAAGMGGGGNDSRNRPDYLEDDENVFGVDRKAAPPVIGL